MIFLRTNWSNFVYKVTFIVRADLPERCSISIPAVINNIYRSAVPAQKYLPERRSGPARSGTTTPLIPNTDLGSGVGYSKYPDILSVHRYND